MPSSRFGTLISKISWTTIWGKNHSRKTSMLHYVIFSVLWQALRDNGEIKEAPWRIMGSSKMTILALVFVIACIGKSKLHPQIFFADPQKHKMGCHSILGLFILFQEGWCKRSFADFAHAVLVRFIFNQIVCELRSCLNVALRGFSSSHLITSLYCAASRHRIARPLVIVYRGLSSSRRWARWR